MGELNLKFSRDGLIVANSSQNVYSLARNQTVEYLPTRWRERSHTMPPCPRGNSNLYLARNAVRNIVVSLSLRCPIRRRPFRPHHHQWTSQRKLRHRFRRRNGHRVVSQNRILHLALCGNGRPPAGAEWIDSWTERVRIWWIPVERYLHPREEVPYEVY